MSDRIIPFKPKPKADARLARLAKLRRIADDPSQMFEVRVMAGIQATNLEKNLRWEQGRRTLTSLMAGT
jgi:hypothetical protein